MRLHASACAVLLLAAAAVAQAHGMAEGDAAFAASAGGLRFLPFVYLGAKHMVTGVDHLLFLAGVVFFLARAVDVARYVTLFAIGHSLTLLAGVLLQWRVDAHAVDFWIALSVVWKALDNLGGLKTLLGVQPDPRAAVLVFGLVHGIGLAGRLQELSLPAQGLVGNLVAFNLGVELGQLAALGLIVTALFAWRRTAGFGRQALAANLVLMTAGFVLAGWQLAAYALRAGPGSVG